eukprot:2097877-Rhodomonas_salina.3
MYPASPAAFDARVPASAKIVASHIGVEEPRMEGRDIAGAAQRGRVITKLAADRRRAGRVHERDAAFSASAQAVAQIKENLPQIASASSTSENSTRRGKADTHRPCEVTAPHLAHSTALDPESRQIRYWQRGSVLAHALGLDPHGN